MKWFLKEVLLVVLLACCVGLFHCQSQVVFNRYGGLRNSESFAQHTVYSEIECASECRKESRCLSANYQVGGSVCELNEVSRSSPKANLQQSSFWTLLDLSNGTDGWVVYGMSEYKLVTDAFSWSDAKANCESLSASLTDITDDDMLDFLKLQITGLCVWTGGNDLEVDKDWKWIEGRPFSSSDSARWSPSEPSNTMGIEHCLELCQISAFLMNDVSCSKTMASVCKRFL